MQIATLDSYILHNIIFLVIGGILPILHRKTDFFVIGNSQTFLYKDLP